MQQFQVDHALAARVSIFHMFLRPVGDALVSETLREVAEMEDSFREELFDVYGDLAAVATKLYQLVC